METASLVLTLKKPVTFEGKTYETIDLTKLEDWTVDDLIALRKKFSKFTGVDINVAGIVLPESDIEYCIFVAAEATGMPIEFFRKLPARDSGALSAAIVGFFHN